MGMGTRLVVWLVIGFAVYFGYGRSHSRLQHPTPAEKVPTPAD